MSSSIIPKTLKPRPRSLNAGMALNAASRVADMLIAEGHLEPEQKVQAAADIASCASLSDDGYQIAKALDSRCSWDCKIDMLDALDCFGSYADEEIQAAQEEWVVRNNVRATLTPGERILLKSGETGVVDEIYKHRPATYAVRIDGDPDAEAPTNARRLVFFEEAVSAPKA